MTDEQPLQRTPLYDLHVELGAKMVPFAGYEMPVQYPLGVLKEHQHTRAAAGLFDVGHMGQVHLHGADADRALETLVPADILGLADGQQRYALFMADAGGILDDLMVTRDGERLVLVVNAACKVADEAHLRAHIGGRCEVRARPDLSLLALQGPSAGAAMTALAPAAGALKFMQAAAMQVAGVACFVSRSGYTGEDGFEISVPAAAAETVARALLARPEVEAIGLGARDSLRLEAGLCLYGHDIDRSTSPIEAGLRWSIGTARRPGGARAGGYPGAERVARELETGPARRRVGLRPTGRAPVREGAVIVAADGSEVGQVTSGGFGPSVGGPVAMGYVATAALDGPLSAMVRGKPLALERQPLPFSPHRYLRA